MVTRCRFERLPRADEIERLRAGLDAAVDKTLKYELDCAGIESRYKDSVELVELRAERGALADRYRRAVRALQDIAALKPKPKTSGKEIAIHALAMIGEPREEIS